MKYVSLEILNNFYFIFWNILDYFRHKTFFVISTSILLLHFRIDWKYYHDAIYRWVLLPVYQTSFFSRRQVVQFVDFRYVQTYHISINFCRFTPPSWWTKKSKVNAQDKFHCRRSSSGSLMTYLILGKLWDGVFLIFWFPRRAVRYVPEIFNVLPCRSSFALFSPLNLIKYQSIGPSYFIWHLTFF